MSRDAVLAQPTVRALLHGAIDYAGLFPPASRDMPTVVADYAAYRRGPDAWALGRLIVPAARLDALADAAGDAWRAAAGRGEGAWQVSAVIGSDLEGDAARVADFNARHATLAVVDVIEARATTPEAVADVVARFPALPVFVEIPVADDPSRLLAAIARAGARAKVRTGGVTPGAAPAARDVARFLAGCAAAGVPFKATAGLHHPLRGEYPLTYEPGSARDTMFGYLNVFLAALVARAGADEAAVVAALEWRDAAALALDPSGARWPGGHVSCAAIAAARATWEVGFGSCSFREPLDDLTAMYGGDAHAG